MEEPVILNLGQGLAVPVSITGSVFLVIGGEIPGAVLGVVVPVPVEHLHEERIVMLPDDLLNSEFYGDYRRLLS